MNPETSMSLNICADVVCLEGTFCNEICNTESKTRKRESRLAYVALCGNEVSTDMPNKEIISTSKGRNMQYPYTE